MKKVMLSVFAGALLMSAPSFAWDLGVVGGLNMSSPSIEQGNTSVSIDGKSAMSYGVLISQSMPALVSFEVGALYVTRKFGVDVGGTSVSMTMKGVQIPVMARFKVLPMVTLGAGGFYNLGLGKVTEESGSTSQDRDYSDEKIKKSDYGLVGGIQLKVPVLPSLDVVGDARYLLGLANVNDESNGGSIKYHDFQVLGGVAFSL